MPAKGFRSITVKESVYDYFMKEWLKVKNKYAAKKGITSFGGYISYRLSELMEQERKRNP